MKKKRVSRAIPWRLHPNRRFIAAPVSPVLDSRLSRLEAEITSILGRLDRYSPGPRYINLKSYLLGALGQLHHARGSYQVELFPGGIP